MIEDLWSERSMLAVEFGEKYMSCADALAARRALPDGTTQAEWYETICQRGDWLLWQLGKLPSEQYDELRPLIIQAVEVVVERAIRRAQSVIADVDEQWTVDWRAWAHGWLDGSDRSAQAARAAAGAAAWAAEEAAEEAAGAAAWAAASWAAEEAAWAAARAAAAWAAEEAAWAANDAVRIAELKQQADDIRRFIPIWPGE